MATDPLDRALSQLNITGLQQSNNALYQVLSTLINQLKNINSNLTTQVNNIPTGGITALTGDVTATGPGSAVATLANTAVTPASYTNTNLTVDSKGRITTASNGSGGGGGTVTTSGSPASGNLTKFSGATAITNGDLSGDVTTSGTLASTIPAHTVIYNKMQQASAGKILLGNGDNGGAHDLQEITLGSGLDISTTVLSVSPGLLPIILISTVVLTDSQIKGLSTTPVNIVTGVASNVIVPVCWMFKKTSSAGSYSGASTMTLRWAGIATDLNSSVNVALNLADTRYIYSYTITPTSTTSSPTGLNLQIKSSADVTGGNAANSLVVTVAYFLMPV